MIRAGELRDKINFYREVRTSNSSGGASFDPSLYLSTFAKVEEKSSTQSTSEGVATISQVLIVHIRYRNDVEIRNGDTVTWRGQTFKVGNILVDALRTKISFSLVSTANNSNRTSQDLPNPVLPVGSDVTTSQRVVEITIGGTKYTVKKGVSNYLANSLQISDIVEFVESDGSRKEFRVKSLENLNLPSDFNDRSKFDQYNVAGPII